MEGNYYNTLLLSIVLIQIVTKYCLRLRSEKNEKGVKMFKL